MRDAALATGSLAAALLAGALMAGRAGLEPRALLSSIPPRAHALALLAFALELGARGLRVAVLARGLGLRVTLATSVAGQIAGDAVGAVTPSRLGADAAKLSLLRRGGVGLGAAGALLLGEMASEAVLLVILAGVVAAFAADRWVALGLLGYAAVVSAAGLVALLVTRWRGAGVPTLARRLGMSPERWAELERASDSFHAHARSLRGVSAGTVAATLGAALLHLAARLAILPALVLSTASVPSVEPLVLRPLFVLYATALLPPPGGGGGVEMAFAATLQGVLAPRALVAVLLWWRFYTFYLGVAVGWLYLVGSRVWTPKILDTHA